MIGALAIALASAASTPRASLVELETRSGGRLGVVLIDPRGREVLAYRSGERFAFCSAFKLALAGAAFDVAEEGRLDLDAPVRFRRSDIPGHAPAMSAKLVGDEGKATLREAIDAAVVDSDNMAANMLIDSLGGPSSVTARWRAWGDRTSRLDRREPALNDNIKHDPRDSSTPAVMAATERMLYVSDRLTREHADRLAVLMHRSPRGLDRVRAGLPKGWSAGAKIGTCAGAGRPNQQYNDVGWFRRGLGGPLYWYAVMLDRPKGSPADAAAIHAEVGRLLASIAR